MCEQSLLYFGLFMLGVGAPTLKWPYGVALIGTALQANSRTTDGPVEPSDGNVRLTQIGGILMTAFGAYIVAGCLWF